jgi:hypothetical protein
MAYNVNCMLCAVGAATIILNYYLLFINIITTLKKYKNKTNIKYIDDAYFP